MDSRCQQELVRLIPHQTGKAYWTLYFKIQQGLEKIENRLLLEYSNTSVSKHTIHTYVMNISLQELLDFRIRSTYRRTKSI